MVFPKNSAFRPKTLTPLRQWVPHISLVFREMWNTPALAPNLSHPVSSLGQHPLVPHLAKNERDMGHPCRWRGKNPTLDSVQSLPAVNNLVQRLMHQPSHLLGGYMLSRLFRAQQISGAIPLLQNLAHCQLDRLCILLQVGGVAQDHGRGKNCA